MKHCHEFEDWARPHEGTQPNRAYYIPFAPEQDPVQAPRETSDRFVLLNGTWQMKLYDSISAVPEDFYQPDFAGLDFMEMPVPSCWEMHGIGKPVYTNMPATACTKPAVDGSPNNKLGGLAVDGFALTPTFQMDTTGVVESYYDPSTGKCTSSNTGYVGYYKEGHLEE